MAVPRCTICQGCFPLGECRGDHRSPASHSRYFRWCVREFLKLTILFVTMVLKNTVQVIYMELPKRKSNRLTEYDYSTPNAYFITVCAEKRRNLFWKEVGAIIDRPEKVPLTNLGMLVKQSIHDIPNHYPAITVDHAVIMPNHIHLLLQIHTDSGGRSMIAPTISTVVRLMKATVSKQAGFSIWQKGFYDHVIRGKQDYLDTWNYIEGNPGKWAEDKLYVTDHP